MSKKIPKIAAAQIDMIWLPPPSDAASPEGFLPRELNNLKSQYGTRRALTNLIKTGHQHDLKVIADIVINHRVGSEGWADFTNPKWDNWTITGNDEWKDNGGTPRGKIDSGDNYHAARDLDHSNPQLQKAIIEWLHFLQKKIGFDGWRYDYTKGYSGIYNRIYNEATQPYFSVGEFWTTLDLNNPDPHRQLLADWVDETKGNSTTFDFTTKGILQQAVHGEWWRLSNQGKAPGLIGWWPSRSVTFIDNHDTGSTQAHWPFPADKVLMGYAYILTHPGIPKIFWDHLFDWDMEAQIKTLINIRKRNKIHSDSSLHILQANKESYVAQIDEQVILKLGGGSWKPSNQKWKKILEEQGFKIWEQS